MDYYLIYDSDGILRIENDDEATITLEISGKEARLLSIVVGKGDRQEGMGSELLSVAEQELFKRGVNSISVNYSDGLSDVTGLLKACDYEINTAAPIMSIDMNTLLSSFKVKKFLNMEIENAEFVPLSALSVEMWSAIMEYIEKLSINLTNSDMARFAQDFSGVTYDKNGEIQAVLLCSEDDDSIHVELLVGHQKADPTYVICALIMMVKTIMRNGGTSRYNAITMLAANTGIAEMLKKLLKTDYMPDQIGSALSATKTLKRDHEADYEIDESIDPDSRDEWRREIKKVRFQSNINLKLSGKRTDTQSHSALQSADNPTAKSGVVINFDKYEDIRDGLSMDDTVRITADNVSDFSEAVDGDVFEDILRPFYRGLAVCPDNDKPTAVAIWKLKNIESKEDNESEIVFFDCENEEDGKTLLEEYGSELKTDSVVKSMFELKELSSEKEEIMSDADFTIKQTEGRNITITVGELTDHDITKRKPLSHVVKLKDLDEKQYKRGVANCLMHGGKGLVDDLAFLPREWFDTDVSCAVLDDDRVSGFFLCHKKSSGKIMIDLLFSIGAEYQLELVDMIRFAIASGRSIYSEDTEVVVCRHSKNIAEVVKKLFPDKKGEQVMFGKRDE